MNIIVNPHDLTIEKKDIVNEGEYNITQLNFQFSKEYTDDLVKKAIFIGNDNKAYEMLINKNSCGIPSEILLKHQLVLLGVYAYKVNGDDLVLRYSPTPKIFQISDGSYKADSIPSEEITPSQFEQYQQALQNGLAEVNAKLQEVINTSETLEENGTYAKKQGDYAKETTDELISKVENGDFNGATFTPSVSNDGDLSWSNDKGLDNPITVNIKGQKGDTGEPFTISKTYPSVEAMEADFDNMEVGDYVMIASSVDDEDNAKLYVKTDTEWVFITDFSGAIGIQGEPGVGIVSASAGNSSESDGYTITPITFRKTDNSQITINVSAKNGEQGPQGEQGIQGVQGEQGIQGDTGVGISTITSGTPVVGEDKTVTPITFGKTDGTSETVNIEAQNGETQDLSGYVTNDVLDNVVPKNTSNGETVSVNDAIAYKAFDFEVDGASEQVTTTGKNLYNYEDTMAVGNDITVDEEGYITISYDNSQGESTVYKNYFTNPISLLKANTNYSFFAEVKSISGQGYFAMVSSDATSSVQQFNIPSGTSIDFTDINNGEIIKKDYTSKENLNDSTINIGVRTFVGFDAGESGSITFRISLLENTSVTSENFVYEPYTGGQPSPSPDYPQEITTLTFNKITRCGKNLFGGVELTKSTVGIDFTTYKDGSISAIGTATNQALSLYIADVSDYLRVLVPGTYTLSGGQDNIQVQVVQGDGTALAITPKSSPYTITFALNETKKIFVRALIDNGVTINTTIYPMLEQGSQATEYEPYQATEYTIDLQGNEMAELPNGVKDELVIDKQGNVSLIKNVGKSVFDGSENWNKTNEELNVFYMSNVLNANGTYPKALSNYFNVVQFHPTKIGELAIRGNGTSISICSEQTSVEEFKSWLSTHNTILYYPLSNPQTIPLGTLSDLITTLNGTNNISINGNIPTNISTTYALDIKKYIDNKLAEISTALIEEG